LLKEMTFFPHNTEQHANYSLRKFGRSLQNYTQIRCKLRGN